MRKTKQDIQLAVLTKPLSYQKDGETVIAMVGTSVLVDRAQGVALVKGDHIYVDPDDYEVISLPSMQSMQ